MTKALFIAVTLAVVSFLALRAWTSRDDREMFARRMRGLVLLLLPVHGTRRRLNTAIMLLSFTAS